MPFKPLVSNINLRLYSTVDNILDKPLDREAHSKVLKSYPSGYHGHDAKDRPVYIERTGSVDFAGLLKEVGAEHFIHLHLRAMEYQARVLLPAASRAAGRPVTQMCNVIDVGDLSLSVLTSTVTTILRKVGVAVQAVGWLKVESAQVQRLKPLHEDPGFERWFQLGACTPTARWDRSIRTTTRWERRRCKLDPGCESMKAPPPPPRSFSSKV